MPPKAGCTTIQRFYQAIDKNEIRYLNFTTYDNNLAQLNSEQDQKDRENVSDIKEKILNEKIKDKKSELRRLLRKFTTRENSAFIYTKSIFKFTPRAFSVPDQVRYSKKITDKSSLDEYKFIKKLNETYRIINARHPFERLFSGWHDKFQEGHQDNGIFKKNYQDVIMSQFYKAEDGYILNMHVPFISFLRYVVGTEFSKINYHFKPTAFYCSPCEIDFDYVSEVETMRYDLIESFTRASSRSNITTGRDIRALKMLEKIKDNKDNLITLKPYKSSRSAKDVFRDISRREPELIDQVYRKFWWDFEMFGYTIDDYVVKN